MFRRLTLLLLTCWLGLAPSWGLNKTAQPLPDFDAAGGIRIAESGAAVHGSAQHAALQALEARAAARLRATFNARGGAARSLESSRPLSPPAHGSPEAIARAFLHEHRDAWHLSPKEVDDLELQTSYVDRHSGVAHVYYRQRVGGVPVFQGLLGTHLDERGRVLGVRGNVFPGLAAPRAFRLSPEHAAEAAASHAGARFVAHRRGTDGDAVVLEPDSLGAEVHVTKTIYALGETPRPAYRMLIEKNGLEWYDVIVDAETGALLHRRNLYQSALTPSSPPEPSPAAPRGLVYVEHPLSTTRGTGDLPRKYPYTVDPTGRPRGFANAPLNGALTSPTVAHGADPLNATLAQTVLPLPNAATPLRSNALPVSTSPQSPQGWFLLQSGQYQTIGNNVDAKDDRANDDEGSIGFRPSGGTTGDFTGPAFTYQNAWGQGGDAALDQNAAILDLFYVTNWYHDLLYHLGFTEAAGNFQKDNFGRGGDGNDYLFADAQDGSGTNNANFGTPADGANPRMQMYLWTGPNRDGDLDFDVIVHEYSHGLSNRLVGGPENVDCLGIGLVGESGGMGEGWGDWFAAVLSDDAAAVEYSTGAGENGIRRFPQDRTPLDWTYRFLGTGPPSDPSIPFEVHDIGELWAGILWEMRESMINRFHNRAFPGGPTFPTFTAPAGSPASNVRNAQGRTTDGSGLAARLDRATIENASFAAMFRVVDGMKHSVCNPTMVDMRDAILAADRAAGGEFVDVIWRTFANRGIGEGAVSTGGEAPLTVEDFAVPATVAACESAGGPLGAPSFSASALVPNTVTLTITPNGATEYVVYRSAAGPGTPVDPTPFVEVGRTSGTTFVDAGLDGGLTYHYRVRAARNDDCTSASQALSVTVLGGALPCTAPPAFAGLVEAADAEDCAHVDLRWSPATSSCIGGPSVRYNVYRSTDPAFTPSAANRIATGVVGTTHTDAPGASDTIFYYVVRAEDSTTGHGGPANGGNEDPNTVRRAALLTSRSMVSQGFSDDVESGPDSLSSGSFTSSGQTLSLAPERGGWFRDSDPAPAEARSGSTVWHTFDPDNKSLSPGVTVPPGVYELRSTVATITPSSILTFHHTFQTEAAFDGGVVEAALVDEATGVVGTFQDLGPLMYENGYNGVLDASGSDNTLANRPAYTGGLLAPMARSRAFLGALVPAGDPSARIVLRFLFGTDVANLITVPPPFEGTYFPGWYVDDVSIDDPCCPLSAPPRSLVAEASAANRVALNWAAPVSGTIAEYLVFREEVGDTVPTEFDELLATVPGTQTAYVDTTVSGGTTYAYVVRAVPATGCPSGDSNVATVTATGACRLDPDFDGIESVSMPLASTCTLDLAWSAARARCTGTSVQYNVYRSIDPAFEPTLDDAIALGVTGLGYTDQVGLSDGVTYYYVVRAEDGTTGGSGPANGGNEDDNVVRRSGSPRGSLGPGPDFSDDLEPAPQTGYETTSTRDAGGFQALPDPTASSATTGWLALDDQPGSPPLTPKDDRLVLPPLHVTSASTMTFFHNYDFAHFPEVPTVQPGEYHSGGVLEISADGDVWTDLGPYVTAGGYTGQLDPGAQSPLAGRSAWTGSSDAAPGTRVDLMSGHPVVVDLGAAVSDPALFAASDLPGARIRFRLGGTFQALIGGIQGTGWGLDDLHVTGLLAPGTCDSSETETCSITDVVPGTGTQGASLDVTISGSGFEAGSSVVFGKDGSADDGISEGPGATNGAGTSITLHIVIDGDAPEGPHDVTVVAPDGSFCIARSAFVVTRAGGGGATRFVPCDDGSVSRKGGWHAITDDRSTTFGQYCRNVGANKGNAAAFLELAVSSTNGGTVSVVYARGPRGGSATARVADDTRRIESYRPPTDPSAPDSSGRNDLTFGFSETFSVPPGASTLRLDVLNDDPTPQRDMVYVEGFVVTENEAAPAPARYQEPQSSSSGTIPPGASVTHPLLVPLGSILLTAIADATASDDLAITLRDPLGVVVRAVDTSHVPEVAQALSIVPGTYSVTLTNRSAQPAPYALFVVPTVDLAAPPSPTGGKNKKPTRPTEVP